MTLALAICLMMVVAGGAVLGWLVRWNMACGDEAIDPIEMARRAKAQDVSS